MCFTCQTITPITKEFSELLGLEPNTYGIKPTNFKFIHILYTIYNYSNKLNEHKESQYIQKCVECIDCLKKIDKYEELEKFVNKMANHETNHIE